MQCNYSGTASDELQLPGEGAFSFTSKPSETSTEIPNLPKDSLSPQPSDDVVDKIIGMQLDLAQTDDVYTLNKDDVETLRRFMDRTVFTIGTAQTVWIYRHEMIRMAAVSGYLTHIVLVLTLMHDRFLSSPEGTPPTSKESFHFYHGTALFHILLDQPIREEDKDPLWATAALLGAVTIAGIEATRPEDSWPLKVDSASDLDWLRMSDGKKEVWRLVDPLRDGSVFKAALSYEHQRAPEPYNHVVPELEMLYPYLTKIYDYHPDNSEEQEDPYHTAASILTRLLELECNHSTIMYFLSFLGHMDPQYRELLHKKDPKALLLLSWWYGKMCQYNVWWQTRRMRLEGQAICMYLEQNHADQQDVVRLLDYPKMMTGMLAN